MATIYHSHLTDLAVVIWIDGWMDLRKLKGPLIHVHMRLGVMLLKIDIYLNS